MNGTIEHITVSKAEFEQIEQAITCPVCGGFATSQSAEGFSMAGGTILCGSGARRSACDNGHVWKSAGYGQPFAVVTPDAKAQAAVVTAMDEKSFHIARELAHHHTKRGWFESKAAALVREIRLRTSIYDALRAAKGEAK